jgi:hypothetical protein
MSIHFSFLDRALLGIAGSWLAFCSATTYAGTTSSGGAEFIGDGHNPWFIENTTTVSYCIIHDPAVFHLPASAGQDFLGSKIRNALAFWKREFDSTVAPRDILGPQPPSFKVATQEFVETECGPATDIRFQFGVLSEDQIEILGDPQKYLAAYARTSYDQANLRGAGFIYLSADSGPLAPADENIAKMPWALGNGGLIEKAIAHELGHVFGLGHEARFGTSYHDQVMGEDYLQWMMHPFNAEMDAWDGTEYFRFFSYGSGGGTRFAYNNRIPGDFSRLAAYFGWNEPVDFVYFDFSSAPLLKVLARPAKGDIDGQPVELGTARMSLLPDISDTRSTQILWVSQEQRLFECDQVVCGIEGPATMQEEWRGTFTSASGTTTRQLMLQRSPDASYLYGKYKVGGVGDDGRIVIDLFRELSTLRAN